MVAHLRARTTMAGRIDPARAEVDHRALSCPPDQGQNPCHSAGCYGCITRASTTLGTHRPCQAAHSERTNSKRTACCDGFMWERSTSLTPVPSSFDLIEQRRATGVVIAICSASHRALV